MDSQCEAVHPQTQGVRFIDRHRLLLACSTHSRRDAIFWHVYVDVLWWHFERRGIFRSDFCGDNYRGLRLPEGAENRQLKESVTFVRVNSTKPTECLVNALTVHEDFQVSDYATYRDLPKRPVSDNDGLAWSRDVVGLVLLE